MVDTDGWEMPADFGECIEEHEAVRERCGVLDRSARARLVVTGSERLQWLQGMVTNDVRQLESGAPVMCACILNATGHLLSDLFLLKHADGVLLDLPWQNRIKILDFLQQYVITEDVEIVDQSEFLACLSVQGPQASEAQIRAVAGDSAQIVAADHTGEGGFDVYLKVSEAPQTWVRLVESGIQPVGEEAAETLRIESGIPRYGVDMDETTIPLECNLDTTHISHSKGCYVGQEIIARIHARGHTNRALTGLLVDHTELPERGERIFPVEGPDATREVGWVTSATHSPTLRRSIALGYLRHEAREPGQHLRTANAIPLIVTELPFVKTRA